MNIFRVIVLFFLFNNFFDRDTQDGLEEINFVDITCEIIIYTPKYTL